MVRESRRRPLFWQLPCLQIVSSRQISNVAEKANRDAARYSGSPKPISSSRWFVRLKGAPGVQQIAELVDANDRRSRASRWRVRGKPEIVLADPSQLTQ